eukprot:jgi/Mesvir1/4932/Mv11263-RA.5
MEPPANFLCPISHDLMRDPVMLVATGQVYERSFIEQWFAQGRRQDPLTNQPVSDTTLVPVKLLRSIIEEWVQEHASSGTRPEAGRAGGVAGSSDSSIPLIPPERLVLGQVLHDGVLASVARAVLQPTGDEVVVKRFRSRGMTAADSARFHTQVHILQRASVFCHNVCRLLGVAEIDGHPCIVMPRYASSLKTVLQQHNEAGQTGPAAGQRVAAGQSGNASPIRATGQGDAIAHDSAPLGLPLARVLAIAQDVALAIADLHERGILVLGVKPSNILLDKYDRAVVADFGMSAFQDDVTGGSSANRNDNDHTGHNSGNGNGNRNNGNSKTNNAGNSNSSSSAAVVDPPAQGTPNYLAPEQWVPDDFGGVTGAADAWAFGCVVVEMAAGAPPWAGLGHRQVMANVTAPRKRSPAIPPTLPGPIIDILRRCFAYTPGQRPPFVEIFAALRLAGGGGIAPAVPTPAPAPLQAAGQGESLEDWLQECPKTAEGSLDVTASLHRAAAEGRIDAIWHFREFKIDLNLADEKGRTILITAALFGHCEVAKDLIESGGMDVRATDKEGKNVLLAAAEGGSMSLVKYLLDVRQVDINAADKEGKTVLLASGETGDIALVRYLIDDKEMDPHAVDQEGRNLLHVAARAGNLDLVRYLVENRHMDPTVVNKVGGSILHYAAAWGHLELLKYLLDYRAMDINARDKDGGNVLHFAASRGQPWLIKYLVDVKGMDVNATDAIGLTMLHCAASRGHIELIDYLVGVKQLDLNSKDDLGRNALHIAIMGGKLDTVKHLVDTWHMSPSTTDKTGNNGLILAAMWGHLDILKYLVDDKGMDPQIPRQDGYNPLHVAAQKGHLDMVKYLVAKGARVRSVATLRRNALHLAALGGHRAVLNYLVDEKGMDAEGTDEVGWNTLHMAVAAGHLALVQHLLDERGLDVNERDEEGGNVLIIAARMGQLAVLRYLLDSKNMDVNTRDSVSTAVLGVSMMHEN